MSVCDELDLLLQDRRLTDDDWTALATSLEVTSEDLAGTWNHKRALVNRELRHSYGNTLANLARTEYEPDYAEIVRASAKKLRLQPKDHHGVAELGQKIVVELIDRAKEAIIKEKGRAAWDKIEAAAQADVEKAIEDGTIPADVAKRLKGIHGGAFLTALLAGRLAGFGLYIVANQVFFAMARFLGLRIGVAAAGPIIGKTLAFFLGPPGWVFGALWIAYDLGDTNWKKVMPAVATVAMLRARLRFED